jgi:hypothetical protein
MYRKAFLAASFAAFLLVLFLILPKTEEPARIPSEEEVVGHIRDFNASVSSIKSISCNVSSIGAKTEVVYIKPSKVLAVTSSFFGRKQAEIGTDGRDYWFWMRDFDKESIYHCPLPKISSTRVVLPMRPDLITSALGVDEIIWESISVQEGVACLTRSEGDLVKCVLFKDDKMKGVTYHRDGLPMMTATFKSHQKIDGFEIPKEVNVFWHEENASLDFEMKNVVINTDEPPEIKMPEGMKKISLIGF